MGLAYSMHSSEEPDPPADVAPHRRRSRPYVPLAGRRRSMRDDETPLLCNEGYRPPPPALVTDCGEEEAVESGRVSSKRWFK